MTPARLALRSALAAAAREAAEAGESRPGIALDLRHLAALYDLAPGESWEGELSPNTAQAAGRLIRQAHADGLVAVAETGAGQHEDGDTCLEIAARLHVHETRMYDRLTGGAGPGEYTGHLQPFAIPAGPDDPHRAAAEAAMTTGWCWRGHPVIRGMSHCSRCGAVLNWGNPEAAIAAELCPACGAGLAADGSCEAACSGAGDAT